MFTGPSFPIELYLPGTILHSWLKLPWSFEIPMGKGVSGEFHSLVGIVNTMVYETKAIFSGLGHDKLS